MSFTLKPLFYRSYEPRRITPAGWLRRQLEIQAEGLDGCLDLIWPDVRDSEWAGGSKEDWERLPYWLDGVIPLAALLRDESLMKRAKGYLDYIINSQGDDGWLGPCAPENRARYDVWPIFLITKVLAAYADCTGDARVPEVLRRQFRALDAHLNLNTLFNWAQMRWYECLIPIYWLWERSPEPWLLTLALKLKAQGFDFGLFYRDFPYKERTEHGFWSQMNHVVNQAMALKSGALYGRMDNDAGRTAETMLEVLRRYHGTVFGGFTGDEVLAGLSPVQGTELCAIADQMYSMEWLVRLTGDMRWADDLETLAFNAFPATMSPDMWSHQYDQMVNQISCARLPEEATHFTSNRGDAHTFGLEPYFGCCTANFGQAWPKFALSSFVEGADGEVVSLTLAPAKLETEIKGVPVSVELVTDYPFGEMLTYIFTSPAEVDVPFAVRIPAWAGDALVDSAPAEPGCLHRTVLRVAGRTETRVELPMKKTYVTRPYGLSAVKRGPLIFAIKVKSRWQMVDYGPDEKVRVFPHCDYDIYPESDYAYALLSDSEKFVCQGIGDIPFSEDKPPVSAKAIGIPVQWNAPNGILEPFPSGVPDGSDREIELIPYGCSTLRVTEFLLKD